MPANYYMPGNVVNPSNDPIVNERLRGLLAAGVDDVRTPGAGSNFGKGLLSGVLGLPGDAMSLLSEIPARLPGPQQGAAQKVRGLLQPYTSDGLAERMGADLSRPVTQAGLIGAPDPKDITDIPKGLLAMTLFHGTPHKFNKFDLSKIGTGEGAQAYGHGLYFAQSSDVAKQYQPRDFDAESVMYDKYKQAEAIEDYEAMEVWERAMMHDTPDEIRDVYGDADAGFKAKVEQITSEIDEINRSAKGHLYEVDIPDETVDKMLDWDAPLSEQPESVRGALEQLYPGLAESSARYDQIIDEMNKLQHTGLDSPRWNSLQQEAAGLRDKYGFAPNSTGQGVYQVLSQEHMVGTKIKPGEKEASRILNEAGIPGIRFFDGNSRSAKEGTRNIVVFDPNDIRQVKRDGIIVDESKLGIK